MLAKLYCCAIPLIIFGCSTTSPQPTQAPSRVKPAPSSSAREVNDQIAKKILAQIVGREKEPAERVFKNIQIPWLKPIPADRFLSIMNFGYSRALGVTCAHCHVEDDFASDNRRPKRAAREMADMHRAINQMLSAMKNLEQVGDDRFINCAVCHRGHVDPKESKD